MLTEILSNSEITLGYGTITSKLNGGKIIPISVPINTEHLELIPRDSDWNSDMKLMVDYKNNKHTIFKAYEFCLYPHKFKYLPNLKKLSIICCTNSTDVIEFEGLANGGLQELVLHQIANTNLDSISNIKSLEVLELRRLKNITDICKTIEQLPKLKKLIITGCAKLNESEFGDILCYCLENKIEFADNLYHCS